MVIRSLASAFLMYSRIPVPRVEWKEENRRYSLCFFPLIGVVTGLIFLLWRYACSLFNIGNFLCGAVSVLIPIIVTGGIHLDGYCDVTDARSSYADREKKLVIMSDPHIGSFAVMRVCLYLILQTALMSEITAETTVITALGFVLSRALSGITAVTFKSAKNEGALQNFVNPAHKKITLSALSVTAVLTCFLMAFFNLMTGISAVIGAAVSVIYYRLMSYKNFGGITGDTAGWFLQICEITMLIFAYLTPKIAEVISLWF